MKAFFVEYIYLYENMTETKTNWKDRWHEIIFEADTAKGKLFDVVLLWAIAISVIAVMLESVGWIYIQYESIFIVVEWVFTILFTIEYLLRLATVKSPLKYALSFYGIVDLLSILPTFLGLYFVDSSSLRVIRVLRLLRVFRVLKLISFLDQSQKLKEALKASKAKILVFLFAISVLVVLLGTVMYIIESEEAGFTSIPRSIYWAIVTLTTVGYGDITPQTVPGQALASIVMILGYAIIAVPTGIVTSEIVKSDGKKISYNTQSCSNCSKEGHDDDAEHCKYCGSKL